MDEEDKQDLKSIGLYYFDLPVVGGGFWPPIIEDNFGGVLIKWFVNSSRDAQIGRLYFGVRLYRKFLCRDKALPCLYMRRP